MRTHSVFIAILQILLCGLCLCETTKNEVLGTPLWRQAPCNKSFNSVLQYIKKTSNGKVLQWKWTETGKLKSSRLLLKRINVLAPTFMLSSQKITDSLCQKENEIFLSDLKNLEMWALKMYDSSGKLTSGILNGNINQFGDFDQCINAESPDGNIKGKYCLAYIQIKLPHGQNENKVIREIYNLIHSHHAFRSEIDDPGNRVPRFSTINWALCIPSSCSPKQIEHQLRDLVLKYSEGFDFDIGVRVDNEMCHIKRPFQLSVSFLIVSILLLAITSIVFISTLWDSVSNSEENGVVYTNLLSCFSLKRNFKELISTVAEPDEISSIHGIRMINALLLLLSHKSMAMFFYPYSNRTFMVENLSQRWTIIARIASLYTDSFIMISGILTSYSFMKTLKKKGTLDIKNEYSNRLIRIFPLLIITILISTFIIPEMGSGPLWGLTVNHYSNACKNSWWKNFLFIHNYFGFENMCLTHTHHLGIDTQLFFLSPVLVYILYKWHMTGIGVLISLAAVSTGLRFHLTTEKSLSYFIYPGISVNQMMSTANLSYIIPSHRITVYVIGLITGYVLQQCGREYKMKAHVRRICWMIAFSFFSYIISKAMNMSYLGYVYDKYEAANYSALAPIAWCLYLSWIIFISHINYGGTIGRILSYKYCAIWTKISYAVYLVQFPIFFYNVGQQRYAQQFSIFSLINILEYGLIILASTILTLFIDMPSNNIRKLLRQRHVLTKLEHNGRDRE